ncbi:hypothetical protein [Streptomyces sp. NPDC058092]|uniref:hypothetical protein n=1 Tax=Streptomyces sp. NPDC058092 TaxID=3346336 RepID=UPI0036E97E81
MSALPFPAALTEVTSTSANLLPTALRILGALKSEPTPMPAAVGAVLDYVRSPKSQALAATRASIFEKNKRRHELKARYWAVSLWSLVGGLGLSTVALLLHT